mgnify:CR=1 FL=1
MVKFKTKKYSKKKYTNKSSNYKSIKQTNKFNNRLKTVNIHKLEKLKDKDDFSDAKEIYNSYFYRTHLQWNNLPLELKVIEDHNKFMTKLKEYLWSTIAETDTVDEDISTSLGGAVT